MSRTTLLVAAALLVASSRSLPAQEGRTLLAAGPMVGHATETDVRIWVQTREEADVAFRYWPAGRDDAARTTAAVRTSRDRACCAVVVVDDLPYGTKFRYELLLGGQPVALPYELGFQTQDHWRWRHDAPDFTVAVGSCAYVNDPVADRPGTPYGDADHGIFRTMARLRPDLMLWLGDNVYYREPDCSSESAMRRRYAHTRGIEALQPFLASTHHYALWDDHDFGPDNSDWTFPLREASLRTFRLFWANPGYGLQDTPGIFTRFSWADAEFFILDDRYYRSPNAAPDAGRSYWGHRQLDWLLDALSSSGQPWKIIANGNQVLNTEGDHEAAARYTEDYQRFVAGLGRRRIDGVVLLSGDVHRTELRRREREGTYPLYEFTSSPLLSGLAADDTAGTGRVPGTLVQDSRNFGRLLFEGPAGGRVLTMECRDKMGALRWRHRLALADLQTPP